MKPHDLPVYQHKAKILATLAENQVIVVESPTGSGKTTQLPIILHEAGYDNGGMIGVTQPRRIAAVSVSDFIQKQLDETGDHIVGYKMRFNDKTTKSTRIKIMTDGILLQEMKLDPMLGQYRVLMVDEAHERSLNIDFILGLLKRVLEQRPEFRVIVSSATINAEVFSEYFNGCPIVRIETETHPVSIIYKTVDSPDDEAMQNAILGIVDHVVGEKRDGDILIFLPGEKAIKDCMNNLMGSGFQKKLEVIPLYGRLSKEEQDLVFPPAPRGKTKVIVATNMAETSITIDGITSVIDSGLAKINFYNPKTFTSSLIQQPISRASANQRRGRAGRTAPGTCYRLYSKDDFERRPLFTQEEIYRTDLSEVVLRMAELGIRDFDSFDFISSPGKPGIAGAVETLRLLEALEPDNSLSPIGGRMVVFPLLPRHSRILVEAIMNYPDVIEEALIGTAFLSTDSPFLLPQGEEMEARKAHHVFRDANGDFLSYIRLFRAYEAAEKKVPFCEKHYLDPQTMGELVNVKEQLAQIIGDMGVPISSGGPVEDYLCAIAKGLIQFICVRNVRGGYKSLTAEKVEIHPSSVMFRETPKYIVAGEIVRTTRTYARSVSALKREWLVKISPELARSLHVDEGSGHEPDRNRDAHERDRYGRKTASPASGSGSKDSERKVTEDRNTSSRQKAQPAQADSAFQVSLGGRIFQLERIKGKKKVLNLSWEDLQFLLSGKIAENLPAQQGDIRSSVKLESGPYRGLLLEGEKLSRILSICRWIERPDEKLPSTLSRTRLNVWENLDRLVDSLSYVLRIAPAKADRDLGFLALYTNSDGLFWFKASKGFSTALSESLSSLDYLADAVDSTEHPRAAEAIGHQYRRLSTILESV